MRDGHQQTVTLKMLFLLQNLREGVYRDLRRQEEKRKQNLKLLEEQRELTEILEKQRDEDMKRFVDSQLLS